MLIILQTALICIAVVACIYLLATKGFKITITHNTLKENADFTQIEQSDEKIDSGLGGIAQAVQEIMDVFDEGGTK